MFNLNQLAISFAAETVIGVVVAVAAFVFIYVASMALYFKLRKKHAYSKFGVEIGIMAFVLIISFVSRFLLFLNFGLEEGIYEGNGIAEIIGTALRAAYSSIGHLTFEGLDDYVPSNIPIGYWMFYWGTAVYCAAMFLSLVTTKVSYEIYSRLGVSKVARKGGNVDLFIFKNATEDTVTLAESIENHYAELNAEYERSKDKLYNEYSSAAASYYTPYSQLKKAQNRVDFIKVKLNKLTKTYIEAWNYFVTEELKENLKRSAPDINSESILDCIHGFILPATLWCAIVKNNEKIASCELISRCSFLDFNAEESSFSEMKKYIEGSSMWDASEAVTFFANAASNISAIGSDCSDLKLGALVKRFRIERGSSVRLIDPDGKVITFPTGVKTVMGENNKKRNVNFTELLDDILDLSSEYVDKTLFLIRGVSATKYSAMLNLKKPRSCRILFLGNELDPFDVDNPLHREIMAHDYYYVSYVRNEKAPVSVFKRFKLDPSNDFLDRICDYKRTCGVHVFSFALSDDLTGDEALNGYDVFEEIRMLFTECVKKNPILPEIPIVTYYLLSDNDVNYQSYEKKIYDMLKGIIEKYGVRMTAEEAMLHFQLNVVNEAAASSKCLVRKRFDLFSKYEDYSVVEDSKPFSHGVFQDNNEYRVAVLGFGQTGQAAMEELFINTSYVRNIAEKPDGRELHFTSGNCNRALKLVGGEPTQFVADIFDSNADDLIGLFAFKHPLFICAKEREENKIRDLTSASGYSLANIVKSYDCSTNPDDIKRLREGVGFPMAFFHNASCTGLDFLQKLDRWTGRVNSVIEDKDNAQYSLLSKKSPYKAFIISLGDDEANISIANALIDDIRRESARRISSGETCFRQTIYVNIRDERNYSRLNNVNTSEALLDVIPFGSRADIYSYDYIIDSNELIKYNTSYNYLSEQMNEDFIKKYAVHYEATSIKDNVTFKGAYLDTCCTSDGVSLIQALSNLSVKVGTKYMTYENVRKWFKLSLFLRQSNLSSYDFGEFFRQYYKLKGSDWTKFNTADILRMTDIEHVRWDRFHIAQGWNYCPKKAKERKEHNCIVPFSTLYSENPSMLLYDLGNVVVANSDVKK